MGILARNLGVAPNLARRSPAPGQTLAQDKPIVLLDEPLAGIDPASRERITDVLAHNFAETRQTVVLSTHEVAEVETLLSRAIILEQGAVRVDEAADALRARTHDSIDALLRKGIR